MESIREVNSFESVVEILKSFNDTFKLYNYLYQIKQYLI